MSWNQKKVVKLESINSDAENNYRTWTRLMANEHVIKILHRIYKHSFIEKYRSLGLDDTEILYLWAKMQDTSHGKPGYPSMISLHKTQPDGLIDPMYVQVAWHQHGKQYDSTFNFHQNASDFYKQIAKWLGVEERFVEMV